VSQPTYADAAADYLIRHTNTDLIDASDGLVARNERRLMHRKIAFHHVNIGATDGADAHFQTHLALAGYRLVHLLSHQRRLLDRFLLPQNHRAHVCR
jgi:hypothetical protein